MFNKLHPLTITEKLTETAEFYKTYFGFEEVFTSDWYIQLAHKKSDAELAIMSPNLPNQPDFLQSAYKGSGIVFTLETKDATKAYKILQQKDLQFTLALRDEAWGQRHFIVQDPSGVYVDVVEYLQTN